MPEIDVRLDTGELDLKLRLHTERAIPILDIEFAKGVTVNGSPDAYREFARDLLDLIDATCPPARNEYADIPVHDGLDADVMSAEERFHDMRQADFERDLYARCDREDQP